MSKSLTAALVFVLLLTSGGIAHALSCSGAQQVAIATRLERPLPRLASMLVYVDRGTIPTFQLKRKGEPAVKMRSKRIAPGLYRYSVNTALETGLYELTTNSMARIRQNVSDASVLTKGKGIMVRIEEVVPELSPVPAVKNMYFGSKPGGGLWSPQTVYHLTLVFEKALPSRFIAVIGAWRGNKPSVLRKPSMGRFIPRANTEITVFATPVRCGRLPARAFAPKDKAIASMALVDEFGNVHLLNGSHKLHLVPGV